MFKADWLLGCPVPIDGSPRGREKLIKMAAGAIEQAMLGAGSTPSSQIPLLLCLSETGRPGRFPWLDKTFLHDLQQRVGLFHDSSEVITDGRVGGVHALSKARDLLDGGRPLCVVAGVDTLLVSETLAALEQDHRVLTNDNSNGFIPGEAASAVLLGPGETGDPVLCQGIGLGTEPATLSTDEPLRGHGLSEAIRNAFSDAGLSYAKVHLRITDANGEQRAFKEAALAMARTLRTRKEEFDIWHPSDCIGEVGAAIVPIVLGIALAGTRKGYLPGSGVLCHFGNDDHRRGSLVLQCNPGEAA